MNETTPATPPPADATGTPSADERLWALFAHLSILLGGLVTSGWGFSIGCFIGPLVIWIIKKDTMPFVNDQAKEALNFAITLSIIGFALLMVTILSLGIGALRHDPAAAVRRPRRARARDHRGREVERGRRLPLPAHDPAGQVKARPPARAGATRASCRP